MRELSKWVTKTFDFSAFRPMLPLGFFANVLRLSADLGLAFSTDGVGTKIFIAQEMGKYDTVGIDCVAMNANDVLCVGARPISMVDYVAVEKADPEFLEQIGKGLHEGARQAGINIPGGEIAQVPEMIRNEHGGFGFDLVGTCVGTVHPDRIIVGRAIAAGDLVVGIASSGIHSNGLTLARKVLFEQAHFKPSDLVPELGRTVGEELLVPTHIYVPEVLEMIDRGLSIKALIHITSDGLMNLSRVDSETGYVIDKAPEPQPIFSQIEERGGISRAEMFQVYNMGTGFCVVVAPEHATTVCEIARNHGRQAATIGYCVHDPQRRVWIAPDKLLGHPDHGFRPTAEQPPQYPNR